MLIGRFKKVHKGTVRFLSVLVVSILLATNPLIVNAITQGALEALINDRVWYDPSKSCEPGSASASTPSAAAAVAPTSNRDKLASLIFAQATNTTEIQTLAGAKAGGIFVRNSGNANDRQLYDGIKTALGTSSAFVAVDFEGGRVQAPGKDLVGELPSAQAMGVMADGEIKNLAKTKGAQLAALGVNMNFAPTVDIGYTNTSVIGDRAFSDNRETVSAKAGAFQSGMSEAGITSVLKHFPGHGSTDGDSHQSLVTTKSLSDLEQRDMKPYQTLGTNAKTAIMVGHLLVPEWGNVATSINPVAYEYARQVLNYRGVMVTDALNMAGLGTPTDQPSRALAAIKAGADVALISTTSDFNPTLTRLESALASGELSQQRVDESVARLEALKTTTNTASVTAEGCAPCPTGGTMPVDGENPKRMFEYLIGKGLTAEQAAGVTGNSMAESYERIDPRAGADSGSYVGIFQWDRGGRWANLVRWVRERTTDQSIAEPEFLFENQLEFAWMEAETRGNIEGLKTQTEVPYAAWYWGRYFEVAIIGGSTSDVPLTNVQHLDKRIGYAQSVYDQFKSLAPSTGSPGGGASCGGAGGVAVVDGFTFPLRTSRSAIQQGADGAVWCSGKQTNCHHDYNAADIHVAVGTVVLAAKDGKVVLSRDRASSCGSSVAILGSDNHVYYYTHMQLDSIKVAEGEQIAAGTEIGAVGEKACGSAPHLHFDLQPPPATNRPGCSGAACGDYTFLEVQPVLTASYAALPD